MAAVSQLRPAPPSSPAPGAPTLRTPLFLLGVGLALFAFVAMFAFGILFANRGGQGPSVSVVVASQQIDAREPILPDMVTIANLPASAVPAHAFFRPADLAGSAAVVTIYKGQTISANLVVSSPDQLSPQTSSFLPIPAGDRAITIPTSELQGVGGYPANGDFIDIYATASSQLFVRDNNPRQITAKVFEMVYILEVGPPTLAPKQGVVQGVATSLTLLMTACDAEYLTWLQLNTVLKYELVSYHDYAKGPSVNSTCTSAPPAVGPAAVNDRWGFTKA